MNTPSLTLAPLFENLMVIPCERRFPMWGGGKPGAGITVQAGPYTLVGTVAGDGRWEVEIPPLAPGRINPFIVESGPERVVMTSAVAGDLWLCAGQSNVAMTLQQTLTDGPSGPLSGDPFLRLFTVDRHLALGPGASVRGRWTATHPEPPLDCPALPFHFGGELRRQLGNRPVGLIASAVGDTPIEAWMSREALVEAHDASALDRLQLLFRTYPDAIERMEHWQKEWRAHSPAYNEALSEWMAEARLARADGLPLPPKPQRPPGPGDPQDPTVLFYGMVAPLLRLPIRGIVWYQGETDAIRGTANVYARRFKALIRDLRRQWAQPDLPFIFVQLPRHDDIQSSQPPGQWALLREAQAEATDLPHVAMVVGLDQGDSVQIHPKRKVELARRLARIALAQVYGCDNEAGKGPEVVTVEREGSRITIRFRHVQAGFRTLDGQSPRGFQVAGHDRCFVDARTDLGDDWITLWNDNVSQPQAVRYAWADDPDPNVFTHSGWPLAPFRYQCGK